jgi:hypothetical protein
MSDREAQVRVEVQFLFLERFFSQNVGAPTFLQNAPELEERFKGQDG